MSRPAKDPRDLSRPSIIAQATTVFKDRGYRGTSLDDVALAFGVSRPALYHYFKAKRDILYAIYAEVSGRLQTGAREILQQDLSPVQKFRLLVRHHAYTILSSASQMAVYYDEEAELLPEQRKEVRTARRRYTQALIDLYAAGVKSGDFLDVPPQLAVYVIIGACNWSYKWYDPQGPVSAREMAGIIENMLVNGYTRHAGT